MFNEIAAVVVAYLIGSIPTGVLLAKAFGGVDIRTTGSGNIGATNAYRTLGRKVGILTLVGDCLKGLMPVLVARMAGIDETWVILIGLAAFIGHVYTIFLGFKGGKGVATALGVFLALVPLAVLGGLGVFVAVFTTWRYISLASICAAAAMPVIVAINVGRKDAVTATLVIATLVIYKHRDNIHRLLTGTETKFTL